MNGRRKIWRPRDCWSSDLNENEKEINHEKILCVECLYPTSVDAAGHGCKRHIGSAKRDTYLRGFGQKNVQHHHFQELKRYRASLQGLRRAERRTRIEVSEYL